MKYLILLGNDLMENIDIDWKIVKISDIFVLKFIKITINFYVG